MNEYNQNIYSMYELPDLGSSAPGSFVTYF